MCICDFVMHLMIFVRIGRWVSGGCCALPDWCFMLLLRCVNCISYGIIFGVVVFICSVILVWGS